MKVETYKGKLLHEPWEVKKQDGALFRVFTAFWRASRALPDAGEPLPAPARLDSATAAAEPTTLEALGLLPQVDWAAGLREKWTPGEAGAHERLHRFVEAGLTRYGTDRNIPGIESTSKLSPYLRFGEVSPRQLMAAAVSAAGAPGDVDKFLAEIGWREFSYSLLYANPKLATDNIDARFDAFPFRDAPEDELDAWRYGRTGYPIVDAGMRELARTGYMHNRVRMVTASFLIKHMLVDWRVGEAWFWDCLCDADPANNPASWQWVAGSGADAAPYFRIFNPIIQGTKFDPEGAYVRLNVPELARMPDRWIHEPWAAPSAVLRAAGVSIGGNYPAPIVEHPFARQRALDAFAKV